MPAERTELDDKIRTPPCTEHTGKRIEDNCLLCQVDAARIKLNQAGNDYPSAGELAEILPEAWRQPYWEMKLERWFSLSDEELRQVMQPHKAEGGAS